MEEDQREEEGMKREVAQALSQRVENAHRPRGAS